MNEPRACYTRRSSYGIYDAQNEMTKFMKAEPAKWKNSSPRDTLTAQLKPGELLRDSKALLPAPYPRAVLVLFANSPSPTQQARPPIPSCTPLSRLLPTRPTPCPCRSRSDIVDFGDLAVAVGGVAVGADGGEGRRRCIGRRSV